MNARQKAKKYKKELDLIKSKPFRIDYKTSLLKPIHLRAYQIVYDDEIKKYGEEIMENEARLKITRDLINNIRNDIKINKIPCLDSFHAMKFYADIWLNYEREAKD